jgi:anthranilate synthase component I
MYYPNLKEFKQLARKSNLIPVYKEISADTDTPVSCFLKIDPSALLRVNPEHGRGIDDEKYSYLLESVEGGEKIARYSFLGSDPSLVFKSKGNQIEITAKPATGDRKPSTKRFITKNDPLFEIKRLMKRYKFVPVKGLPRFCGGLVGYIGYDTVRFFENIPDKNPDDLNIPDSIFILTDTILIFDHVDHKIKVVSNVHVGPGQDSAHVYADAIKKIDTLVNKLKASSPQPNAQSPKPSPDHAGPNRRAGKAQKLRIKSNMTKKEFAQMIIKAKKYIRHGDIIQTVLSQRFQTHLKNIEPFNIYRSLRSVNPSPYMYYLNFGEVKLVGSSPEIMVRCEEGLVEVRPIAGTRPRGKNAKEDERLERQLLADPKERAEHIMLVDLGRNDIGRVCNFNTVKADELMIIEKYSHVMHIVSDVTGKLQKGKDIYDVIRATFPAGTVSGAPKVRAMEIIDELENVRRGPYAGCIGYFSFSGNLDTCITIRTLVIKGGKAYVQAGAGIVADSVPFTEYKETQNKARALIKALELAGSNY